MTVIIPKTIPDNKGSTIIFVFLLIINLSISISTIVLYNDLINLLRLNYLNPIAACHTNANSKKKTGITGNTSTIGLKITYASGKRDNSKVSINSNISLKFF